MNAIRARWFVCAAAGLLLAACGEPSDAPGESPQGKSEADAGAKTPFSFLWEFWSRTGGVVTSVESRTALPPRSPIYMRLGLNGSCHVYVLTKGDDGWAVLYPGKDAKQPAEGIQTILRRGSLLDAEPGKRRVYVFASSTSLPDLEARIGDFKGATDDDRSQHETALADVVQSLRKEHEQLKSATTKPASIGGTVRGPGRAIEIQAHGVYAKTYSIEIK